VSALPAWADNEAGHEIIAAILRERPECRITRGAWIEGGGNRRYIGKTAAALRRLHHETAERLFEEADEAFARGVPWAEAGAEANACLAMSADKLIEQLLANAIEPARHVLTDRVVRRAA
jgi:hypothetical protein